MDWIILVVWSFLFILHATNSQDHQDRGINELFLFIVRSMCVCVCVTYALHNKGLDKTLEI